MGSSPKSVALELVEEGELPAASVIAPFGSGDLLVGELAPAIFICRSDSARSS
jgi:hypothetical protein